MLEKIRDLKSQREKLEQSSQSIVDAIRLRAERPNIMSVATMYCKKLKVQLESSNFDVKRSLLETLVDEVVVEAGRYRIKCAVSFHIEDPKPSITS